MSLILFGLDAAQIYSIKEAQTAWFYSLAINQINNAEERLIALKNYDDLDQEINLWNKENQTVLPNGFGTIIREPPNYIITIYWGKILHDCKKQQMGQSGCLTRKIRLV